MKSAGKLLPQDERRQGGSIRRRRASILLTIDRLGKPDGCYIGAEDLAHLHALEPAADAAYAALAAALESRP